MRTKKQIRMNGLEDVREFVKLAGECDFDIDIYYNRITIDAKSILGVLSLDLTKALTVEYAGTNDKFEEFLTSHFSDKVAVA